MQITLINQFFHPDTDVDAQFSYSLSRGLVKEGLKLTILCQRGLKSGNPTNLKKIERKEGFRIFRLPDAFSNRNLLLKMLRHFIFYLSVLVKLLSEADRNSCLLVNTSPPLMGFVSLLAKTFTGCRYMLAVRDVYPDALYSAGILGEGSIFYRFLDHLLKISMNHAEKVLTLGRDMSQRIKEKRVPGEKIEEVPNWGLEKLHPLDKEENYMVREMGLEGKFVILYSGNFGYAHEFDTVLAGCRQLSEKYNNMHFIFIGRGKRLGEIKKFFEWNKDIDCSILDYLPLEKLNYSLNIADVTLVTMREGWDGVAIPSKTYSQMAVGKPIIYVGPENDISRTLENVHCGYSVRNGDVGSFIKRVSELYKDRTLRERMGKNARLAYEKKYNRERAIEQYVKIFRESFL